jgi:hypothetical protein
MHLLQHGKVKSKTEKELELTAKPDLASSVDVPAGYPKIRLQRVATRS